MCAKNLRAHLSRDVQTLFGVCTAGYGVDQNLPAFTHPELPEIFMVLKGGLTRSDH